MNKKIVTRFLAMVTSAVMLSGVFVASAVSPVLVVEAADSNYTQSLRAAFDPTFYANKYPDVKKAFGTNADALFSHFMNNGMKEGRMINANFDPKAYLDAYPDVKASCKGDYAKAYEHYYNYGAKEGRNLTTYDAINKKNAAEQAKAAAAAEAQKKATPSRRQVNIGHGLVVSLDDNEYRSCSIAVLSNDYGFAAYVGDDMYASSGAYSDYGAYLYSNVTITNGNVHETVFSHYYNDYDEAEDALITLLLLAALADDAEWD